MKRLSVITILFLAILASTALALDTIQTQMSTDGNFDVSLIRAGIKGDVLTVQVLFKNTSSERRDYEFGFGEVYYTDTKNKKKYYGLKDAEGHFIAGPAADWLSGGHFSTFINPGGKAIFWIKFPAPPESTDTIDIYIPWALPFDDVKLER